MEQVSVQFALLAIARPPASVEDLQTASQRATDAGHRIVAEETIVDAEATIRDRLAALIADPEVDVVLVLAGAGSDAATKALKPLVSEVLPGFTDLFRWLMFQEAGASAMLSSAEAAQCGSTIVFVLPGAIAAAMDKLILPQFDPKTTPRNLVEKLPRLRTEPSLADEPPPPEAIPQVIEAEKTQGGSGLPARLPAIPSGRLRSRTGAHVIHREQPTDDPTKPIDLVQLESELAASASPRAATTPDDTRQTEVAMAQVPPPGVDPDTYEPEAEDDHTDVTLAAPPPPALGPRPMAIPSIAKPAPRKPPTKPVPNVPSARPSSPSTPNVPSARPSSPSTPNVPSARPSSPSTPNVPAARPSSPSTPNTPPAVRPGAATPRTPLPAVTINPRARTSGSGPQQTAEPSTPVAAAAAEPSKPLDARKAAIEAQRAADALASAEARKRALTPKPMEIVKPAVAAKAVEAAKPVAATPAAAPDHLDDEQTVDGLKPVGSGIDALETLEASELVDAVDSSAELRVDTSKGLAPAPPAPRARPPTEPPPPPAKRPPTAPQPVVAKRPPTAPQPVVAKRPSTAPQPVVAKRSPTAPPPARASADDLPQGKFAYPVQKRRGSLILKLLAFAAIIGIGFGAVVLIFREKDTETTPPPPTATPAPTPPPVATTPTPTPTPAPTPPPVEPDIEIAPPPQPPVVATTDPKPARPTRPPPPRTGSGGGSGSGSATGPVTTPTTAPVTPPPDAAVAAVADDCDETACILSKYDRACCAKYKPATTDFKPRVGDVPESLDKSMVRAGVEHVKPRVVSCGEKSGVKGTVKIALKVSPDGAVTDASVADTPDATLGDCVLSAMRSAKFGKTVNGASFTYPFAF